MSWLKIWNSFKMKKLHIIVFLVALSIGLVLSVLFSKNKTNFFIDKIQFHNKDLGLTNSNLNIFKNNKKIISNANINTQKVILKNIGKEIYDNDTNDWNMWKNDIISELTMDFNSMDSLEKYKKGTNIYYSFFIDNKGNISNIKVWAFGITKADKKEIINTIKSYEHNKIVKFPKNSTRKKIKVSVLLLITDKAQNFNPDDF